MQIQVYQMDSPMIYLKLMAILTWQQQYQYQVYHAMRLVLIQSKFENISIFWWCFGSVIFSF